MKYIYCCLLFFLSVGLGACSTSTSTDGTTVRVRWTTDPENLDPLLYLGSTNATQATNLLHCSLLIDDYVRQKKVPLLAAAMPAVQYTDSLTLLTYQIRSVAAWDDGRPVLAQDVAFTLAVMNCPGLPNEAAQAQFSFIERVEPDPADPRRFTFVCRGRSPEYPWASGDFPILPAHILDPQGTLATWTPLALRRPAAAHSPVVAAFVKRYTAAQLALHPMRLPGCGPYRMQQWEAGRYLRFQRKPSWWGDQVRPTPVQLQAYPQKIVFEIIPDENTAVLALRRGQVDVYPRLPAREFDRLRHSAAGQDLAFYVSDSYEMLTAGFNTRRPELRDPVTRRALSRLFNVPALIVGTQRGYAYRSVGLISPKLTQYYNDSLALVPFKPEEATALLRQAGWQRDASGEWQRASSTGGLQRLALSLSYRAGEPAYEAAALQFQDAAASVGIPIKLLPTERSLLIARLKAGETDLYLLPINGNPSMFNFAPILHSGYVASGNYSAFGTPASDQLIEQLAAAENPRQKEKLARRFQRMMQQECPFVVLYFLRNRLAANKHFTGLEVSGLKPGYNVMTIRPKARTES